MMHNFFTCKDKEASFNIAFETDNISSVELFTYILNKYFPAFLYLPGTTVLLRASTRELPTYLPFLTPLVWRRRS